jgi:hypothetical protein
MGEKVERLVQEYREGSISRRDFVQKAAIPTPIAIIPRRRRRPGAGPWNFLRSTSRVREELAIKPRMEDIG